MTDMLRTKNILKIQDAAMVLQSKWSEKQYITSSLSILTLFSRWPPIENSKSKSYCTLTIPNLKF